MISCDITYLVMDYIITQTEIAEKGGFNQGIYANWETNRFVPGAENLIKLADCFGCSVDYLLGRENEESIIVINEDMQYTLDEKKSNRHVSKT